MQVYEGGPLLTSEKVKNFEAKQNPAQSKSLSTAFSILIPNFNYDPDPLKFAVINDYRVVLVPGHYGKLWAPVGEVIIAVFVTAWVVPAIVFRAVYVDYEVWALESIFSGE